MYQGFTKFVCLLAAVVLGFADLRLPPAGTCTAAESCCCCDSGKVDPCLCGDHPGSDIAELAPFEGFRGSIAAPAEELLAGDIAPLAELPPRWRPTVPWRAPPKETRARLSVWLM